MFRYRLAANLMRAVGPRSRFLEGPGLFQQWKAPSEQPCRQMTTSRYAWRHNKTLYVSFVLAIFAAGNAFYGYELLRRARERDVDRAERHARMERQMKARSF